MQSFAGLKTVYHPNASLVSYLEGVALRSELEFFALTLRLRNASARAAAAKLRISSAASRPPSNNRGSRVRAACGGRDSCNGKVLRLSQRRHVRRSFRPV